MILTDKFLRFVTPNVLLAAFGCLCLVILTAEGFRHKHPVKTILFGGGSGILALIACHLWGATAGVYLPLTVLHLSVAFVLGIPGVLLMLGASAIN